MDLLHKDKFFDYYNFNLYGCEIFIQQSRNKLIEDIVIYTSLMIYGMKLKKKGGVNSFVLITLGLKLYMGQ